MPELIVPNRKLKARRTELALSQKDIAEKIGISIASYSRKENNHLPFTVKEVKEIKRALELSNEEAIDIFFTDSCTEFGTKTC